MAKTLATVRTQVRSFLDEPIAADWTNIELDVLINHKYHEVYSAVIDVFEEYATLSTANSSIVADQQEYSLPSDFLKIRRVEITYSDDSSAVPQRALPLPIDQIRRDLGNQNTGINVTRNPVYYLRGDNFGLVPVPDVAVTNGIKIWYYAIVSDLSSDSSEFDLPYIDRDWMLIAYGATADALRFGQQESVEADKLDAKYTRGIKMMQQRLEDRISEEAKYTVDIAGNSLDFGEWGF